MRMGPHHMLGSDPEAVKGIRLNRYVVKRAWAFARPYRWAIAGFIVTIVLAALLALVPPLLFRSIIDRAIPDGNRRLVTLLAVGTVAAAAADALLAVVQRWYSARIGEGLIFQLRVALFDKVQHMPIAFFTRTQTGALISRLNNDVIGAQDAVTGTLGSIVSNVIVLGTTLAAMFFLEWRLTLIALVVLPLFVLPAKRVGRRMQAITRERMDLNARMNTQMTERFNVSGAMLVKLYGRHGDESRAFSDRAARVRNTGVAQAMYGRVFFVAMGLVAALGSAAVYGIGGQLVIDGAITIGTLVALAAYVTRIYQPLTSLTNARVDLMTALVSFERVFEVLDAPVLVTDRPGAVDLVEPKGRIEIDHVSFAYPSGRQVTVASLEAPGQGLDAAAEGDGVLSDISLTIEPGQLVALVGPSGAGKSTLASLVPRLYDVTSGTIRVDGYDVRDLTQQSLRAAIGVVAQDPHLFHESIADNLRYARPGATMGELEEACRAAQIHDVIASLPDGYDTVVGERGYRLSGGEKQRVAIARMLLKDPAVVILDEATSHLDSENEALVGEALDVALEGRTSIVIAHRLSTIRAADVICVLDDGRVVERGTHDELMAGGGLYADLYRTLLREPSPVASGAGDPRTV
ncbi:MAG TPA: ABC transporter ATP-binding protein [Acidimicrobiales bacterium]